jgi:hypothetical protein
VVFLALTNPSSLAPTRAFTFDSSRRLNCHSNFIPKIALPDGHSFAGRQGINDRAVRQGTVAEKREADMADIEFAAAEPRDVDDCFGFGMVYSVGVGVGIDLVQAHKWFNIAAMRGHKDAARLRREIAEQMSDGEVGSAQRAARDWLKLHPQAPTPVAVIRVAA